MKKIKVLVLEDRPNDAELNIRAIRKAGFDPDWTRVETEEDFVARLHPAPDLILADFQLPHLDGLRAIDLAKVHAPEVPIIIISGSLGDELAAQCIKRGANDYLLKDRLARLGLAVTQVLEACRLRAEQRRGEQALRESHAHLNHLVARSPTVIYALELKNPPRARFISENISGLAGFTVAEALQPGWWNEYLHPDDRKIADASLHTAVELGTSRVEYRLRQKSGRYIWVEDRKRSLPDANGGPQEIVGGWTDITARKEAEEALRESEEHLQLASRVGGVGTFERDHLTGGVYASPILLEIAELPPDQNWLEALVQRIIPEDRPAFLAADERINDPQGDGRMEHELRLLRATGDIRWLRIQAQTFFAGEGAARRPVRTVGAVTDITPRKQGESALREQVKLKTRLAETTAAAPGIMFAFRIRTDGTMSFPYVSPKIEDMLGLSPVALREDAAGFFARIHPDDVDRFNVNRQEVVDTLKPQSADFRMRNSRGDYIWISGNATVSREPKGHTLLHGFLLDATERKRAESRAHFQHAVTRVLADAAPQSQTIQEILEIICRSIEWDFGAFWYVDRSSETLHLGECWHAPSIELEDFKHASEGFVFESGEGLPGRVWAARQSVWIADLIHDEQFPRRAAAIAAGFKSAIGFPIELREEVWGIIELFSKQSRPPDPEMTPMLADLGLQMGQFIRRQQLENQFRQAQKMEAIGTLAGGIAHDFNNMLGGIMGYAELARMGLDDRASAEQYLDSLLQAAKRASALVRQILTFSRRQDQQRSVVQLRHIVAEAIDLLRATIPSTIEFKTLLETDLPTVLADPTQIHQVVLNLCTNAWHAMKDRTGRLAVRLEKISIDAHFAATTPSLGTGAYVRLTVSDTGHGMTPSVIARIFEPFFTTKAPGEGTGLGLSAVHGIMQSHEGAITVQSQPGVGTTFHLYFPAHADAAEEGATEAGESPRGHGQRILFVDDEAPLAQLGRFMLDELGYEATVCFSAMAALDTVRSAPERFDLVITDLTMPEMTGTDLTQQLHLVRPDLPVILSTGYMATLTPEKTKALGIKGILLKPHTLHSLAVAVREALSPVNPG